MELYRVLRNAANGGASVVVLSSDAIELQGLCDRVSVFSRGGIVRTLTGDEITNALKGIAPVRDDADQKTPSGPRVSVPLAPRPDPELA